ncbi:hypothetical protein CR513_27189, partial [Mucuna pruriens]
MVHGFPSIKPQKELCEGCLIRKQTINSIKSNIPTTKVLLEVVYSDVCGPMESVSLGGNHYFISFVDDFSRKFKAMVEKQYGQSIKVLRTNGVGRKPAVSHFWIFGSLCFKHVPDERRKKLDDKGQPMMFLGYDSTDAIQTIVLSKDVTVDKSKGWRWETITKNGKKQFRFIHVDLRELDNHMRVAKEGDMMHLVILAKTKPLSFE